MIYLEKRLFGYDEDGGSLYYAKIAGLSSDSKPTIGLVSGSLFEEVDTGVTYIFDGISDTPAWTEKITVTSAASGS